MSFPRNPHGWCKSTLTGHMSGSTSPSSTGSHSVSLCSSRFPCSFCSSTSSSRSRIRRYCPTCSFLTITFPLFCHLSGRHCAVQNDFEPDCNSALYFMIGSVYSYYALVIACIILTKNIWLWFLTFRSLSLTLAAQSLTSCGFGFLICGLVLMPVQDLCENT